MDKNYYQKRQQTTRSSMSVNPRLLRFAIFVSFYFLTFGVTLFWKFLPSINVMAYIIAHDSDFRTPFFKKNEKFFSNTLEKSLSEIPINL